ncbi:hypothetical protein QM480_08505 [Flectobacillus sp. DC10W]|uniref:Glycosyltransferase family 61 protein n=1 Tax=Flectobacillus longus TaxID=2984207 RepID=A0ABT6YL92_9BACT|nr:hypothetical protein [Flectobacillus longus]MDI9864364.1 hypothetical protein [Flectobacillus longus]
MFEKILNKFLSLIVLLRHGRMTPDVRYYYRHTYRCQLTQLKYVLQDYVIKKPYKEIEFQGEFAPELEFTIPFAYWHFKNGTLKSTKAALFTKEMYFFSPHHEEVFDVRTNEGNYNFELPRVLYSQDYDMSKWLEVPYKEHFKNDVYVYEKPMLMIANRYNMEWGGAPISFYSIEDLDFMISHLKKDYTILYNRPRPQNITNDTSDIYELNDYEWLAETHPEVVLMEDLYKENKIKARNYNHFQLSVYANCEKFISIHGGTAALASCFKGANIILSKKGPEHHFGCFKTLFPKLSGATIYHAKTNEEARDFVLKHYVKS